MITVVIPTYNERENIKKLLPGIFRTLKNAEVIVVDDNSQDGTADAIRAMKLGSVRLISRPGKMGIGSAYKTGFRAARGDIIFEMDADLSHSPAFMPKMLRAINEGADIVVGSRYMPGGSIVGWGFYRKTVSKAANVLSHMLLGLGVNDVTSGFRAYRRTALESINMDEIESDGYSFQLEILCKLYRKGFKVKEVPIKFEDRKVGQSKLGRKEMLNYIKTVMRLMVHE